MPLTISSVTAVSSSCLGARASTMARKAWSLELSSWMAVAVTKAPPEVSVSDLKVDGFDQQPALNSQHADRLRYCQGILEVSLFKKAIDDVIQHQVAVRSIFNQVRGALSAFRITLLQKTPGGIKEERIAERSILNQLDGVQGVLKAPGPQVILRTSLEVGLFLQPCQFFTQFLADAGIRNGFRNR